MAIMLRPKIFSYRKCFIKHCQSFDDCCLVYTAMISHRVIS